MSKTFLFSIGAVALYLLVVKPANKEEIGVESSTTITDDILIGGFDKASHSSNSVKVPVHTL